MKDFNLIAGYYDRLKLLVFGDRLDEASYHFLDQIRDGEKVLILGGGSGEILQRIRSTGVTYVESSSKMIQQSEQGHKAIYVNSRFEDFHTHEKFDWIICAFFLDVYPQKGLTEITLKLSNLLSYGGRLLVTDFQSVNPWQQSLFYVMYLFFYVTTHIRHLRLPAIHFTLIQSGFEEKSRQFFMKEFIFSRIYTFKGNPA